MLPLFESYLEEVGRAGQGPCKSQSLLPALRFLRQVARGGGMRGRPSVIALVRHAESPL